MALRDPLHSSSVLPTYLPGRDCPIHSTEPLSAGQTCPRLVPKRDIFPRCQPPPHCQTMLPCSALWTPELF